MWRRKSGNLTGASTDLQFAFRNDQNAFALDDISVQPIPAPWIQTVARTNGSLTLTWTAVPGLAYQVQTAGDLNGSVRTNLGSAVTALNLWASTTDTVASGGQRFYRVVLLP